MAELAKRILRKAFELIHSEEFLTRHREQPKDFSRRKKLGFVGVITITLGIIVKPLLVAVDDYLEAFAPAGLFLMNVEASTKLEIDEIIRQADEEKPPKYPRKTNENILLGLLRKNLPRLLTEQDDQIRDAFIDSIVRKAAKNSVQIKPGRSFDRSRRSHKRITESKIRCL